MILEFCELGFSSFWAGSVRGFVGFGPLGVGRSFKGSTGHSDRILRWKRGWHRGDMAQGKVGAERVLPRTRRNILRRNNLIHSYCDMLPIQVLVLVHMHVDKGCQPLSQWNVPGNQSWFFMVLPRAKYVILKHPILDPGSIPRRRLKNAPKAFKASSDSCRSSHSACFFGMRSSRRKMASKKAGLSCRCAGGTAKNHPSRKGFSTLSKYKGSLVEDFWVTEVKNAEMSSSWQ